MADALGLRVLSAGGGRSAAVAPWRPDLAADEDGGVIASGVVTTLLDQVCGMAVSTAGPGLYPTATLDLRIDYMRPAAKGAGLTAEAHCYKVTRSVAFVRAEAWDANREDLVASAQATFMLSERSA